MQALVSIVEYGALVAAGLAALALIVPAVAAVAGEALPTPTTGLVGLLWAGVAVRLARSDRARVRALRSVAGCAPRRWSPGRRDALTHRLYPLVAADPVAAVETVELLYPADIPPAVCRAVRRAWVQGAGHGGFDEAWPAMARLGSGSDGTLVGDLQEIVVAEPAGPSAGFRAGAARTLTAILSGSGSPAGLDAALSLLELLVGPGDHAGSPAYWHCVLGDAALARGATSGALRHLRRSLDGGFAPARERLAHAVALDGYDLLRDGRLHTARQRFDLAGSLDPDPEYVVLASVAELLADPAAAGPVEARLARLGSTPDTDLWTGVARLGAGDPAAAATVLRRSLAARRSTDPDHTTRVTESLLAVAEGGADGVVSSARELVDRHGIAWPTHSPVHAERVVTDVAEHEPALLDRLLEAYPDGLRIGPGPRARAAHALLGLAVRAPHAGVALARLELAERLLGAS